MPSPFVLDPGHGGSALRGKSSSEGARFADGVLEKDINLSLARRVAYHLGGAELTRDGENRSLQERIDVARRSGARVFVSLHSNPHGTELWVHDRATHGSLQLAAALGERTGLAYGGQGHVGSTRVSRGQLGVLCPEQHGAATAACLLEIGYDQVRDPARLDATAAQIAGALRAFVAPQPAARATYGGRRRDTKSACG
jgi:N-acetylmuramoyl-L-alanine amidase